MRKLLFFIFFVFVLFFFSAPVALAQTTRLYWDWAPTIEQNNSNVLGASTSASENASTSVKNFKQFDRYLLGGNLTPDSVFYFIKPLQENVQMAFTFDQAKKSDFQIGIAGERLAEMQELAKNNKTSGYQTAANSYETAMQGALDRLQTLKTQKADVTALSKTIETETAKHDVVLEQVAVQAPVSAKASVDKALEASWKGTDTIADLKGRPAVPPDVVSRLQSLKSQGLLTQEEVTKLISAKSRTEARTEIGKYVNQGVVSPSDFLRMNEATKTFYPDEFYKIHETLRFQEMQKLESEKPDDATLNKIQTFAKSYQPGDPVPSELRKYWVPVTRLEEIQNTLRPDLIDANLFKQNDQESKKFNEVVERFKPRPEDIAYVKNFIQKNKADISSLPPEYQRMYGLAQKYGAQCGAGFNWVPEPQNPAGGYCVPNGTNVSNTPKFDNFAKGKSCSGSIVSAKGSGGACSAYQSDCIPPGWSRTDSCVATPTTKPGQGLTTTSQRISCPSNAHFVSVSYDPNGGYCIPNYTQVGFDQSTGAADPGCPGGYHQNYSGGPCIPPFDITVRNPFFSLPPLTTTPGGPYYTSRGQCGQYSHWVPEPINPNSGYCADNNYQPPTQDAFPGTNGEPRADMGNCRTPGECYDWCKVNPGKCGSFDPNSPRPGDTTGGSGSSSRESQEVACRSGGGTCTSWNNGACSCTGYNSSPGGSPSPNSPFQCQLSCPPPQYLDGASCSCKNASTPNNNPSGGCPNYSSGMCGGSSGAYFDWGSCSCKINSYTPPPSGTPPSTPPSGYGQCTSPGQYWNGSACVSNPPPSSPPPSSGGDSPQTMCQRTSGCSWNGSMCNCSTPPSSPPPASAPPPSSPPPSSPPPSSPPPSSPPPSSPPPSSPPPASPPGACPGSPGCP